MNFYAELPIIGLVGGRGFHEIDWAKLEAGCERLQNGGVTRDPLVRHADGVAMLLVGPLPKIEPGPVNSLANAWLEWDAGRNILGLAQPWHIGVPLAEYVRDVQRASRSLLPENRVETHESGQFFSRSKS